MHEDSNKQPNNYFDNTPPPSFMKILSPAYNIEVFGIYI